VAAVALLGSLLLASTVTARALYSAESLERWFGLEWTVRPGPAGAMLEGYVSNKSDMEAERMQVSNQHLAPSGQVVGRAGAEGAGANDDDVRRGDHRVIPPSPA